MSVKNEKNLKYDFHVNPLKYDYTCLRFERIRDFVLYYIVVESSCCSLVHQVKISTVGVGKKCYNLDIKVYCVKNFYYRCRKDWKFIFL